MDALSTAEARWNCQLATQMCHVTFLFFFLLSWLPLPQEKDQCPDMTFGIMPMLSWFHSGVFYRQLISWCVTSLLTGNSLLPPFIQVSSTRHLGWKNWWNFYNFDPTTLKLSNRTHRGLAAENDIELAWKGLVQSLEIFMLLLCSQWDWMRK